MRSLIGAAAVSLALMSGSAFAQTSGDVEFGVTLTIAESCIVNAATDIEFGTKAAGDFTAAQSASASFTLQCTNGADVQIAMNDGSNYDLTNSVRRMKGLTATTDYVQYALYQTSDLGTAWDGSSTMSADGTGTAETYVVYARIPAYTTIPPAQSYSDTVTIDITY